MGLSFTPEQQKVIDLHNRNILVSAAAGSGKTAVLVERIVQMVCDESHPVDIDRLLIVTFTNAAAAEMRERISLGIAAQVEQNPESSHIERQATLLHNALITTIDSFCLYLIKNHFHEIGLDPAFRVADEGEIKLLKQEIMDALLEDSFGIGEEGFLECVEFFCPGGKEKNLEELIKRLHEFASSHPWPGKWLRECKKAYDTETEEELEASPLGQYALYYLKQMVLGCVETMKQVVALTHMPDGPYMYGELAEEELEKLQKLAECEHLQDWEVCLSALSFGRLSPKKDPSVNEEKKVLAKDLRDEVKSIFKKLQERFFGTLLETTMGQIKACKQPVDTLVELTLEFSRRLQEKKQEKKILDFSDMEHYALDILFCEEEDRMVPSKVALEYREYFAEILIDEYQDSNLVQELLLQVISGEDEGDYNRFMVGDVKQSIYKFRQARPELFLEKYQNYSSEDSHFQRIDLSKNFRSRSSVLDTTNHVFERLMSEEVGGIPYDEKAALYVGAEYPTNADSISELLLLEKPTDGTEEKEAEGRMLARKIKELKQNYLVTDKENKTLRPVRYSDMVILLRATSGWDEAFKKALEAEGIPVYITSKTGYFAATEVQELLQFLRVLVNPRQDIPLFGVMKSLFGGFTEEEIALIRSRDKSISLWECVQQAVGEGDEKCAVFLATMEKYRSYTVYMPIRELLQTIVEDFAYLHYVTALPAGSKRKANVEMLFNKASDFAKTSYYGLFHFVRYIEQLEKYDVDYGQEEMLDESADVVRIMSIHKSKGLEFPVTFVAGLAKSFNLMDVNKSFLMDMDLGVATDYVNIRERYKVKSFLRSVMAAKLKEETLAEELRVLYVALTRAKEKLILTATLEEANISWEQRNVKGIQRMSFADFLSAGSLLDFLLPTLQEEDIQVSFYRQEDLMAEELSEQLQMAGSKVALEKGEEADATWKERLESIFSYQYPHENLQSLYTKTTVSELKIAAMADKDEAAYHAFEETEATPILPVFMRQQEQVGGTIRGNAYHKAMELIDFAKVYDEQGEPVWEQVEELLEANVVSGRLDPEYKEILNKYKLLNFLKDPLAKRMYVAQQAGLLYREQPFVLGISADRLNPDFPSEEKVLIQGIIDAFFVENGEIVLLDYKTDRVSTDKELWDRYETQLDHYKEALTKLMQMPVKERILYSFSLERCVSDSQSEL
ncbi:MAG: helicase-exonuclease AddAB subunit AddA [Lachnospiraceae bacterium]|nr:helicase-exonuclease AddAB subunit AddA [Lachnospiraceae bacterium]